MEQENKPKVGVGIMVIEGKKVLRFEYMGVNLK